MTFLAFFVLSAILWVVQSLNEDVQRDFRCTVRIANVPDTLTRISPLPEAINVSVRARGTQLIKYLWGKSPQMVIDFRSYKSGNRILFGEAALKAFFRNMIGGGCQVQSVTPDSLSIAFTTYPGVKVPVKVDARVIPAHQYVLTNKVSAIQDSVMLYSLNGKQRVASLKTVPIDLTDVNKSLVLKVPVSVPANCRAIPDSVDVRINVEPLVSKTRNVRVTPINVPSDMKLVPVPSQIEVYYMLPMSAYKQNTSEPDFKITADYTYTLTHPDKKIPVTLSGSNKDFINVFLASDSVDYIIERK